MPRNVSGGRLYHYSAEPFAFDRSRVYTLDRDGGTFKPSGLWVSVEKDGDDDDGYRSWKEWCEAESFNVDGLAHRVEVVLTPDANVLVISDEPTLLRFHREYHIWLGVVEMIDWRRVMPRFDGLIIAPMIWSCRLDVLWYYGWDCSSGCIWNLNAVAAVNV